MEWYTPAWIRFYRGILRLVPTGIAEWADLRICYISLFLVLSFVFSTGFPLYIVNYGKRVDLYQISDPVIV